MAIYSLNHRPIGKTTQPRPYTTQAHVDYITRDGALSRLDGARLPVQKSGAMQFFRTAEDESRANGRVADKLMLALPRELDGAARADLVRGFAEEVTGGRAPWLAAFHESGKDAANPHVHLLIRDRDPASGRRVFGTSEKGSTERLRALWEAHANAALALAGCAERIDRRTLEAQGLERAPQVHEGPRSRASARRGHRPRSKAVNRRNGPGARRRTRSVDYPAIDRGRTRGEFNAELNGVRETEGELWAAVDANRRAQELETLRRIHHPDASVQLMLAEAPGRHLASQGAEPGRRRDVGLADKLGTTSQAVNPGTQAGEPLPDVIFDKSPDQVSSHRVMFGQEGPSGKEFVMDGDDFLQELQERIEQNEREMDIIDGQFIAFFNRVYLDPVAAMDKFDNSGRSEPELYDALRYFPDDFGAMPTQGVARDHALDAARRLPDLFADFRRLRDTNDGLRKTLELRRDGAARAELPSPPSLPPAQTQMADLRAAPSVFQVRPAELTPGGESPVAREAFSAAPEPPQPVPAASPAVEARPVNEIPRGDLKGLWRQLSPDERELALRGGLARKQAQEAHRASPVENAIEAFRRDPDRPVKSGPDAPTTRAEEYGAAPNPHVPLSYERPQTPHEQQRMSFPQALWKKGMKPVVDKVRGFFGQRPEEPVRSAAASPPAEPRRHDGPAPSPVEPSRPTTDARTHPAAEQAAPAEVPTPGPHRLAPEPVQSRPAQAERGQNQPRAPELTSPSQPGPGNVPQPAITPAATPAAIEIPAREPGAPEEPRATQPPVRAAEVGPAPAPIQEQPAFSAKLPEAQPDPRPAPAAAPPLPDREHPEQHAAPTQPALAAPAPEVGYQPRSSSEKQQSRNLPASAPASGRKPFDARTLMSKPAEPRRGRERDEIER